MNVDQLVSAFLSLKLPKKDWTHETHLKVGLWHLLNHSPEESLQLLRDRIIALNESHGVINSDASGNHETITAFYIHVISAFIAKTNISDNLDTLAERLISLYGAKDLPLRYYSREVLFSKKARKECVQPDKQRFDFEG